MSQIKLFWTTKSILLILLLAILLAIVFLKPLNADTKQSNVQSTTKNYQYKSFSISPDDKWILISYFEYPNDGSEEARFSQRLGDSEIIDMYIKSSYTKVEKDTYTSKKEVNFMGKNATKFTYVDCGGGKAMGSYCEYIVFNYNNKWFTLSLFDYGGRIGSTKDEKLFNEFMSSLRIH